MKNFEDFEETLACLIGFGILGAIFIILISIATTKSITNTYATQKATEWTNRFYPAATNPGSRVVDCESNMHNGRLYFVCTSRVGNNNPVRLHCPYAAGHDSTCVLATHNE